MIRTYNKQTVVVENGVTMYLADIFCNSTDTKPTANLVNGSKLTEVDTGKTFLYDEANTEWVEYSAGGGEGGSVCVTFTNLTPISQTVFSATASMNSIEIKEALLAGKSVFAIVDTRALNYKIGLGILESVDVSEGEDAATAKFNAFQMTYPSVSSVKINMVATIEIATTSGATLTMRTYTN